MSQNLVELIKERCLEYGDFRLASGLRSKYFIDLSRLTLSNDLIFVVEALQELLDKEGLFKAKMKIGGMETGVNAIIGGLMVYLSRWGILYRNVEGFVCRKDGRIDGFDFESLADDSEEIIDVLMIEDVTTTGGSVIKAIEKIKKKEKRINVIGVVTIIDREQGARGMFEEMGIRFYSLVKISELLDDFCQ